MKNYFSIGLEDAVTLFGSHNFRLEMDLRDHVVYYTNEEIIPIKPLKVIEPVSCEAIYRNLPV